MQALDSRSREKEREREKPLSRLLTSGFKIAEQNGDDPATEYIIFTVKE